MRIPHHQSPYYMVKMVKNPRLELVKRIEPLNKMSICNNNHSRNWIRLIWCLNNSHVSIDRKIDYKFIGQTWWFCSMWQLDDCSHWCETKMDLLLATKVKLKLKYLFYKVQAICFVSEIKQKCQRSRINSNNNNKKNLNELNVFGLRLFFELMLFTIKIANYRYVFT